MTVTEKVAYLRGLMEGLDIDAGSKEGRIFKAVIDVLDDLALTVSDIEDSMAQVSDQLESMDEDIEMLCEDLYGDEDDEDDEEIFEVTCPGCSEKIDIDAEMLDEGSIECPNCGELLEFETGCDDSCDCQNSDK